MTSTWQAFGDRTFLAGCAGLLKLQRGGDLKNGGHLAGKPKDTLVDFTNNLQVLGIHGWVHLASGMGRRATGL